MAFNKDELVPPPWMDQEFFQVALKNAFIDSGLKVTSIDIKPGSKPGEHFASIMFRVVVEYQTSKVPKETQKISTVVKTMPFVPGMKMEALADGSIFETEIKMYKKVLPEMERLLRQIGDETVLAPRLFYAELEPHPVMVFEDISPLGYVVPTSQLCFEDAKKITRVLAKFHATSMVLNEQGLDLTQFDKYFQKDDDPEKPQFFKQFFMGCFDAVADTVKRWPEFEKHGEKLANRSANFWDEMVDNYFEGDKKIFKVLIHGDFHIRNFMFRFENGSESDGIKDIFLLDYQVCFWTTPAVDLIYLIIMVSNNDVKLHHGPDLIACYYEYFSSILEELNYKGRHPTLLDVNLEVLRTGYVTEVQMVCCLLPFFMIDLSKMSQEELEMDWDNTTPDDQAAFMKAAISNPVYTDLLKELLKKWWNLGYLN